MEMETKDDFAKLILCFPGIINSKIDSKNPKKLEINEKKY